MSYTVADPLSGSWLSHESSVELEAIAEKVVTSVAACSSAGLLGAQSETSGVPSQSRSPTGGVIVKTLETLGKRTIGLVTFTLTGRGPVSPVQLVEMLARSSVGLMNVTMLTVAFGPKSTVAPAWKPNPVMSTSPVAPPAIEAGEAPVIMTGGSCSTIRS